VSRVVGSHLVRCHDLDVVVIVFADGSSDIRCESRELCSRASCAYRKEAVSE
jgi:hypothetical protein